MRTVPTIPTLFSNLTFLFGHESGLFFLVLLKRILFTLSLTASQALGGQSLVTKGRPRSEVLAALAPLDFQTSLTNDPYVHIAGCTEALVLRWNNRKTILLIHSGHVLLLS